MASVVIPGQIVVVSTVSAQGEPKLAPKSWVTMAGFTGPTIAFGCNVAHATYQNIAATRTFVINIPAEPLAEQIWLLIRFHGTERLWQSGFTLRLAQKVKPPIIAECRAHLECELDSVEQYADEVVIMRPTDAATLRHKEQRHGLDTATCRCPGRAPSRDHLGNHTS